MRIWSLRFPTATLVLFAAVTPPAAAETPPAPSGRADFVAASDATSVEVDLRTLPIAPDWRPGEPFTGKPRRFEPKGLPPRAPATPRRDPLLDLQVGAPPPSDRAFAVPLLHFAGMTSGAQPPDTTGDVGPSHYIQVVNGGGTRFTVYRKSDGAVLAGPLTISSLGTGGCASGRGDGIVLYDSLAGRWLLSQIGNGTNQLCLFVSKTGDPIAGGWWAYQFTTPQFPDYPKYGVWRDAYIATANESSATAFVYALDRNRMLDGLSATLQRFSAPGLPGFTFQVFTPADADGSPPPVGAPGYLLRHRDDENHTPGSADPTRDFVELFTLSFDFATPANSLFSGPLAIPVAEFDSSFCGSDGAALSCIPQTTGSGLDALREPIMNRVQYRNFGAHETLVGNFVTDVDGSDRAGVRWFELRKTGAGAWGLFQEGTYSPDATRRWIGSIAMDRQGNIALGYSASSVSVAPAIRYAGRLAGDPPGTLPQGETSLQAGTGTNPTNRWGDYAAMTVDPADDCTFWFTTEYASGSGTATRIAAFRFDGCTAAPASPGSYFTVPPCRLVDTRTGGGGVLSSGIPRNIAIAAHCGVPLTAVAIAGNVTAIEPTGGGFFSLYPGGASPPATTTINFGAGQTRANNAILALGPDGTVTVSPLVSGGGQAHLVIDVTGYFE